MTPIRINKYLADKGHSTRRGADLLIEQGRVFVNGKKAQLGDKVTEADEVEVRFRKGTERPKHAYYAYNKPRGVVTHSAEEDQEDIEDVLPQLRELKLFPVGRLDRDSHGLIILTNDGRVTDRLLSPSREHDKEYVVRTKLPLRPSFKTRMEEGVVIEGYQTKPAKVRIMGENVASITLTEGKKHQVRRMVVALHNEVQDLKRVRVMNVKLGTQKAGTARPIEGKELEEFLTLLGLTPGT